MIEDNENLYEDMILGFSPKLRLAGKTIIRKERVIGKSKKYTKYRITFGINQIGGMICYVKQEIPHQAHNCLNCKTEFIKIRKD